MLQLLMLLLLLVFSSLVQAGPVAPAAVAAAAAAVANSGASPQQLTAGPAKTGGPAPGALPVGQPQNDYIVGGKGKDGHDYSDDDDGGEGGHDYSDDDGHFSMETDSFNHHGGSDYEDEVYGADYEEDEESGADYQLSGEGADYSGGDDYGFYEDERHGDDYGGDDGLEIVKGIEGVKSVRAVDQALPLTSVQKVKGAPRPLTKVHALKGAPLPLDAVHALEEVLPLTEVEKVTGLEEVQSIEPIPEEVAKKFIRDKGLKTLQPGQLGRGGGGGSKRGSGGSNRAGGAHRAGGSGGDEDLLDLLAGDGDKGGAEPLMSADEAVPSAHGRRSSAEDFTSGHERPVHSRDKGHHVKGLQRILDLFGIKSLDQITDVIPIESIHEVDPSTAKHIGGGGGGGGGVGGRSKKHYSIPETAGDEGEDFGSKRSHPPSPLVEQEDASGGGGGNVADTLAPIQQSLAKEEKAANFLEAALKRQGAKVKAIERVKQMHDVKRLEAIKRLEEVKQLLEVTDLKEVKSLHKVKSMADVKSVQSVKSIQPVEKIFPLTSAEAAELKEASRQYHSKA